MQYCGYLMLLKRRHNRRTNCRRNEKNSPSTEEKKTQISNGNDEPKTGSKRTKKTNI